MSRIERIDNLGITDREIQILELLRIGVASNKEIGVIMDITPRTVKVHKNRLFAKLGIERGREKGDSGKSIKAILTGMRMGLIAQYLPRIDQTQTQIYRDGMKALGLDQEILDLENQTSNV